MAFFRGNKCSQNDIVLTNDVRSIKSFQIDDKSHLSDHCPCFLSFKYILSPSLNIINDCADNFKSYDHFDISKRLRRPINLKKLDLVKLNDELLKAGNLILTSLHSSTSSIDCDSVNNLCNEITDCLYQCCNRSRRHVTNKQINLVILNRNHCSSKNFKAIVDANLFCFTYHRTRNNHQQAERYKNEWLLYQEIAWKTENEELKEVMSKESRGKSL